MLQFGITGKEKPVIENNGAVSLPNIRKKDVPTSRLKHQRAASVIFGLDGMSRYHEEPCPKSRHRLSHRSLH